MSYTVLNQIPAYAYRPGAGLFKSYRITYPASEKQLSMLPTVSGARRLLTPGEYEIYRRLLEPDNHEVKDYMKAAIATVLRADLVRLYSNEYFKLYPDQLVTEWYEEYKKIKDNWLVQPYTALYLKAKFELNRFETFLTKPTGAFYDDEDLRDDLKNQQYFHTIKKESADMDRENRINAIKAIEDAARDEAKQSGIDKRFVDDFTLAGKERYKIWVRRKLPEYLNAIYSLSPFARTTDYAKSFWDKSTRIILRDLIISGKLDPLDGLDIYRESLELMLQSTIAVEFYYKRNKLFGRFAAKHPLLKVM